MKVDLIIKNGWVYRTYRQCFEKMDIAVAGETFYDISPVFHKEDTANQYWADRVVDCQGCYVIPGLIDIHMHVESSMTVPTEFSRTVLPYGVTTVVADPHEIANVFGLEGIRCFMEQETALDIFYGIPSCVPATNPSIETSGGVITEEEVKILLEEERVLCLGEVMNYKDLTAAEETRIKRIVALCQKSGRGIRLEGHCPALSGQDLAKFLYAGVDADHTQQTPESVREKADMGMFLELQAKSLTRDVVAVVERDRLYETVALVTDDTMPDHLVYEGQLNRIIRLAIAQGMPVEKAIYCSTLTPARRMHLDDRGMIAPGKRADFVILKDLERFIPAAVYKNGKSVYPLKEGESKLPSSSSVFPRYFYHSVNCREAAEEDFVLDRKKLSIDMEIVTGHALVSVMQIQKAGTTAKYVKRKVEIRDGRLCWQEAGLTLAAIYERYGKCGTIAYGLVEAGFTRKGAVATTWAHDSHNLLVLGNSPEDMVIAQKEVLRMQGGYVAAAKGRILASASLNVGGIVSDGPIEKLAEDISRVRQAIEGLGYDNSNVIMSISTLPLLVSPELKLSDKGLFEVKTQRPVPLIESCEAITPKYGVWNAVAPDAGTGGIQIRQKEEGPDQ